MFWWFDCFPNRTLRKMLKSWWEGRLLSPRWKCQGHNKGKRGFHTLRIKAEQLFFHSRCHWVWCVFVLLLLKCIPECCRQNCLQWGNWHTFSVETVSDYFSETNNCYLAERVCNNLIVTSDSLGIFANRLNFASVPVPALVVTRLVRDFFYFFILLRVRNKMPQKSSCRVGLTVCFRRQQQIGHQRALSGCK